MRNAYFYSHARLGQAFMGVLEDIGYEEARASRDSKDGIAVLTGWDNDNHKFGVKTSHVDDVDYKFDLASQWDEAVRHAKHFFPDSVKIKENGIYKVTGLDEEGSIILVTSISHDLSSGKGRYKYITVSGNGTDIHTFREESMFHSVLVEVKTENLTNIQLIRIVNHLRG